jgi:hypothetical protein
MTEIMCDNEALWRSSRSQMSFSCRPSWKKYAMSRDVADREIHVGRRGLLIQVGVGLSWCGRDVTNCMVHIRIRIIGHPLGLSCDVIDPRMYTMILGHYLVLSWTRRDVLIDCRIQIRILGYPLGLSWPGHDVIDPRKYTMIIGRPVSNWFSRDGIDRETNIVPLRHLGRK